ncbi:MAG TPA: helix-turn-helix domain-containing protein [Sphingomicrobium sp.]|nr:helix-turn-helix domain-containing protein [Sphingomicrobium sp.]
MVEQDETIATIPVGEQLLAAREKAGISLEDIAAQTRIPTRHLQSIELSEWDKLPAPTYTMGFAKSYATAVGLDRNVIADQLRDEMGSMRATVTQSEVFEPVDPARVMPRGLVIAAIAAAALIVAFLLWNQSRALDAPDNVPAEAAASADNVGAAAPAAVAPTAQGPVVITANEQVWIQVKDGAATLKAGMLEAGQSYEVPATAKAPTLTTGKPEALRVSVGTADAPPVGPAATTVTNVSLLGPDLLRGPASVPAAAAAVAPLPPAAPASRTSLRATPRQTPAATPPAENAATPSD